MEHCLVIILFVLTTAKSDSTTELVASARTVAVNDSLVLTCSYKGNDTVNDFAWIFEGKVFDIVRSENCEAVRLGLNLKYNFECPNINRNSFIIEKVTRSLLGKMVSCMAYTDTLRTESNSLRLDVQVPVTFVEMTSPTDSILNVNEKQEIQFVCTTSYGNPAANVTWFRDSATPLNDTDDIEIKVNISSSSESTGIITSVLKYYPAKADTGISVYCSTKNIHGQKPLVSTRKPLLIVTSLLPIIVTVSTDDPTTTIFEDRPTMSEYTTVPLLEITIATKEIASTVEDTTTSEYTPATIDGGITFSTDQITYTEEISTTSEKTNSLVTEPTNTMKETDDHMNRSMNISTTIETSSTNGGTTNIAESTTISEDLTSLEFSKHHTLKQVGYTSTINETKSSPETLKIAVISSTDALTANTENSSIDSRQSTATQTENVSLQSQNDSSLPDSTTITTETSKTISRHTTEAQTEDVSTHAQSDRTTSGISTVNGIKDSYLLATNVGTPSQTDLAIETSRTLNEEKTTVGTKDSYLLAISNPQTDATNIAILATQTVGAYSTDTQILSSQTTIFEIPTEAITPKTETASTVGLHRSFTETQNLSLLENYVKTSPDISKSTLEISKLSSGRTSITETDHLNSHSTAAITSSDDVTVGHSTGTQTGDLSLQTTNLKIVPDASTITTGTFSTLSGRDIIPESKVPSPRATNRNTLSNMTTTMIETSGIFGGLIAITEKKYVTSETTNVRTTFDVSTITSETQGSRLQTKSLGPISDAATTAIEPSIYNSGQSTLTETQSLSFQATNVRISPDATTSSIENFNTLNGHGTVTGTRASNVTETQTLSSQTTNVRTSSDDSSASTETSTTVNEQSTRTDSQDVGTQTANVRNPSEFTATTIENSNTLSSLSIVTETQTLGSQTTNVTNTYDALITSIGNSKPADEYSTVPKTHSLSTQTTNVSTQFNQSMTLIKSSYPVSRHTTLQGVQGLTALTGNVSTPLEASLATIINSNTVSRLSNVTDTQSSSTQDLDVTTSFADTSTTERPNTLRGHSTSTNTEFVSSQATYISTLSKVTSNVSERSTVTETQGVSSELSIMSIPFNATSATIETPNSVSGYSTATKAQNVNSRSHNASGYSTATKAQNVNSLSHNASGYSTATKAQNVNSLSHNASGYSTATKAQNVNSLSHNASGYSTATKAQNVNSLSHNASGYSTATKAQNVNSLSHNASGYSTATNAQNVNSLSHNASGYSTATNAQNVNSLSHNASGYSTITTTQSVSTQATSEELVRLSNTTATVTAYQSESSIVTENSRSSMFVSMSAKATHLLTQSTPVSETMHSSCPELIDSKNTQWNVTHPGYIAVIPCPAGISGNVTRQCTASGTWLLPKYDCVRKDIEDIRNTISAIKDSPSAEVVEMVLGNLSKLTSQGEQNHSIFSGEIEVITSTLDVIVNLKNSSISQNQSSAFMETVSNLLDIRNADSWQSVDQHSPDNEKISGAGKLLNIVDIYANVIAKSLDESEEEKTFFVSNLLLQVGRVNESIGFVFPDEERFKDITGRSVVHLPPDSLKGSRLFSAVMYRNLSGILSTKGTFNSYGNILGSAVAAVNLDNWTSNNNFNITIEFEHFKVNNTASVCSFRTETSTLWEKKGCILKSQNSTTAICECNHLTNFAILMSPWTMDNTETKAIRVISILGCSLSTLGLVVTMFTHIFFWRYLKSDRVKILMNLCVALVISYIIFLAGVDRTENKEMCIIVAVLLQYIFLVVFFLMLAGSIEIAFVVLYVFATNSRLKWCLPAAWLIPGMIVGISVGVTRTKGYGNNQFCWLSLDSGLIWAFVGPALVIIVINSVILGFVLRAIFIAKMRFIRHKKENIITWVRCLCVLLPLIGCSWIIGIFYVNKSTAWIQYVSAVCNASQGFVIFLFHCAFNTQVKKAYKAKQQRSESLSKLVSKLYFVPRVTNHTSSSALYSISSSTGEEFSGLRVHEIQENEMDSQHHIEMKRFRYITDHYDEVCTRL